MKPTGFFLIKFLILLSACSSPKPELTGIWQDYPLIGSGWSDTYQFYPTGTFIFSYNQMQWDKRVIRLMGKWKMTNERKLMLTIEQKVVHEGGILVPSTGISASEYEIEGGEIKTINLDTPEILELVISEIKIDQSHNLKTIEINNITFWQLNTDPDVY